MAICLSAAAQTLPKGDFGKAESAQKRSLAIRERGTDPAALATTLNNLGNVYFEQQGEGRAWHALSMCVENPGEFA